ncbi:ADAMTS-like protein 1, partial [Armadillidium nasatum]
ELKEETLSTLFEKEEPLMRFSADPGLGVPKFLGKGTRESLEFEWKVTNWTECSQTCSFSGSSGGYQVRSTQCIVRANNISQGVDGALCEDAGLVAPPTIQRCGFEESYQKRNVTCLLHNGSTVSPENCDEVTKPRHKRECYNRECVGVWRTGDWSRCTAPCGGQGYRTRLLQCVWNGTKKSAGNACREQPRPEVVKWCDGDPCEEEDEEKPLKESQCKDLSRYCRIVQRINMCRIQHYRRKCCRSCQ